MLLLLLLFLIVSMSYLSWLGLSWGVSSEEALPKILLRASAYSASRWANDFICWEGRDEDAGFPAVPLFEGRFKIRICGGGAAGRESSWITIAVRTGEPPDPKLDFLYRKQSVREIILMEKSCILTMYYTLLITFLFTYFASWFIFNLASSLLSISWGEGHWLSSQSILLTCTGNYLFLSCWLAAEMHDTCFLKIWHSSIGTKQ